MQLIFRSDKNMTKIKTYMAGPMDDVSIEVSRDWRDWLTEKLKKMNIKTLNPITKYGDDYGAIRQKFAMWQKFGNVDAIRQIVSTQIIPPDLKMVKECDFVTLYISPKGYEMCGSYGEMTFAFYLGKPVYIVTRRRLKPLNLPKWSVGCSTKIFTNWKDYLAYITENYVNDSSKKIKSHV